MGDNVHAVREGSRYHVTSPTNAGIGVVFTDENKFTLEASTVQLHYSSLTAVPDARIEFKKRINGVLQTVYVETLSLDNTGGAERTVSFTLPTDGTLGDLSEVVFATSGGGALDLTFYGLNTQRIVYNFPLGIKEIALAQPDSVETTPSIYNLGAAHMFRPAQVETLLQGIIANHRDLISSHGLWEGVNMTSGTVVHEQVFNNMVTFILGMTGTGPAYMKRYLENKGLAAKLESIWNPQTPVSVTAHSTAYDFTWNGYNITSWKLNENVQASSREIRFTYQSAVPIQGVKLELKHPLSNQPAYSVQFDLPATGGAPGEFVLTIPSDILYWYISEMVILFPGSRGFPSATIKSILLAPAS
jgi:hypothetical protein